jgi:hypothetical protein
MPNPLVPRQLHGFVTLIQAGSFNLVARHFVLAPRQPVTQAMRPNDDFAVDYWSDWAKQAIRSAFGKLLFRHVG